MEKKKTGTKRADAGKRPAVAVSGGEEKRKRGHQSKYTAEIAEDVCVKLARGESLNEICAADGFPVAESSVREWALNDVDGFAAKYARARELQADHYFDLIRTRSRDYRIGIKTEESVDDEGRTTTKTVQADMIERSRLEIDALKWITARIAPKRYGDRLALTDGEGKPLQTSTTVIALAEIMSPEQLQAAADQLQIAAPKPE
jgi:hypothetical protein